MVQYLGSCFPCHNFASKTESNFVSISEELNTRYCLGCFHDVVAEFGFFEMFLFFQKKTSMTISGYSSEMKANWVQSLVQSCDKDELHHFMYFIVLITL